VIVAWSAASVQSDWVRDEAAHARDRARLVPVSLDGTQPPLGFRQYHCVDLSRWRGKADSPEIESILAGIAKVAGDVPPPSRPGARRRISRRSAMIGGGLAVAAAAGGMATMWQPWSHRAVANSIAVIPFANLSGDSGQAYFSDGLSEEIRASLARNPALKVAAPTSANAFRDRTGDARTIGGRLGVAYLLEGSVRRAGNVVRIAAELIDTKSGFSKWSQSFDRKLTDIFAIQSEIAAVVTDALAAHMADGVQSGGTSNVAAFDAFLRARALYNADLDEKSDLAALALYDQAIAADPSYAMAHAGRSRTLATIANEYAEAGRIRSLYDDAIASARRAVALAPDLAEAQIALGFALNAGRLDPRAARPAYDRAASLGAGDADIQLLYAIFCARTGRFDEATAAADRAMELDRLNPRAFRAGGLVQYLARKYEASIPLARRALQLSPTLRNAHYAIGNALLMLNRTAEARAEYAVEPLALYRLPGLAIAEAKLGNKTAADAAFRQLQAELGDNSLYQQAQVLAQWGERPRALEALARARRVGDAGLLMSKVDPLLDPVRDEPAFSDLLNSLHLA
jgi:TolB-like protein/tetratricopeptide (TPR) repeat protein